MFISEKNKSKTFKSFLIYVGITAFIALFGYVYEIFGRGVYSLAMYLAFLYPLGFGCLFYLALWLFMAYVPSFLVQNIYNTGVAILTCGSIYRGVVEIYGTPREALCTAYVIIGSILVGIGLLLYIISFLYNYFKKEKPQEEEEF